MKEYNVKAKIKKMSRPEGFAIVIIVVGAFKLLLENWSLIVKNKEFSVIIDDIVTIIIGVGILINSSIKIKKIRGNYLKLEENNFSFKSNGIEKEFDNLEDIQSININDNKILIKDKNDFDYIINLDDYITNNEPQEIKEYFQKIK